MTNSNSPTQIFKEDERPRLQKLFINLFVYLGLVLVASLLLTIWLISKFHLDFVWIAISAGVLGSTLSSLTSVLNRRANGFEDSAGTQTPDPATKKERFNEGMVFWFVVRPWFGGVIGAVAHWGFASEIFSPKGGVHTYLAHPQQAAFYGFLAGLLAKSLVDILKGLVKNIFKQ